VTEPDYMLSVTIAGSDDAAPAEEAPAEDAPAEDADAG